ncbi:hypothetical protein CFP56_014038, partial [Quercus suber]
VSREKASDPRQGKRTSLISRASRNVSQSSIVIHAKRAASKAAVVLKKLLRSTGKAVWTATNNSPKSSSKMPMSREAINNSDSLLLGVGSTGLREDISLNQKLDYATITSTSSTPNWVLKLVNEYSTKEESFATPRYCPMPCTMFRAQT